jgi:hypothetical protein
MKMTTVRALSRRATAGALLFAAVLASTTAMALPELGSTRPDLRVADAWDRPISPDAYAGKPMLVIYEDKGSVKENEPLKSELTAFANGNHDYVKRVALVAVADLSDFNYRLLRGFVRRAIKAEASKRHISIYCDWDGGFRGTLDLPRKSSNVVLYGTDGKVVFARSGALSATDRAELFDLIRKELGEVATVR